MAKELTSASEPEDIAIQMLDGSQIPGRVPLVLIGPNGSGKTRYGSALAKTFNYDRVPALRSLAISPSIPFQKYDDAKRNADQEIQTYRDNVWREASEINSMLSELKAEDAQSAIDFRDAAYAGPVTQPGDTRLRRLLRLWETIFPGRQLDLSTYDPRTKWAHPSRPADPYGAHQMSDGERGALYLIARVLRARPGVVVVDEPEVHFHSLLARTFWDMIESERPDCRFVYITHDLPFAMSRRGARIALVRSENTADVVPEDAPIPPDVFEEVLGAASLSVVAKRIVFCEGGREKSIDSHIYDAWFHSPETVVVPVGSGIEVQRAVTVFKGNPTIANAECVGIVERDYWPESYLNDRVGEGLHVLPAHEVEGLLCLPEVVEAVAQHLGMTKFDEEYAAFEQDVRKYVVDVRLNKLVLERAKREIEVRLIGLANHAVPDGESAVTRANLCAAVDIARKVPDVGAVFDSELALVQGALGQSAVEFLRILPGKDCLELLLRRLGIKKDVYIDLIVRALRQSGGEEADLRSLGQKLETALSTRLPSRARGD